MRFRLYAGGDGTVKMVAVPLPFPSVRITPNSTAETPSLLTVLDSHPHGSVFVRLNNPYPHRIGFRCVLLNSDKKVVWICSHYKAWVLVILPAACR